MILKSLLMLAAAAMLAAQTPPAQDAAKPAPTGSLSGTVKDAVTGAPIPGARFGCGARVNGTGPDGRYACTGLASGTYTIGASKPGYQGARKRMRLAEGEEIGGIDFALYPDASISGTLVDENKNPVIGAVVSLWHNVYMNSQSLWQARGLVKTNDLGEYHITGLASGTYYVGVAGKRPGFRPKNPAAKNDTPPAIAPIQTFYPGAPTIEEALPVTVGPGEQRGGVTFVPLHGKTYCASGSTVPGASLGLYQAVKGYLDRISTAPAKGFDAFELCGLAPGQYSLIAVTEQRFARQDFSISDRNLEVGLLLPAPGMKVPGKVTVAEAKPGDVLAGKLGAALRPADRHHFGEREMALAAPSGDFEIPSVFPGEHWLDLRFLQRDGHYVKEARLGNRDALRETVFPGSGELRIVLATDGPKLSVRVVDAEDKPIGNAVVVLAPAGLPASSPPGTYRAQNADQYGQFEFANMPPGDYRLFAFADLDPNLREDPEFLRKHLRDATLVKLSPREARTVDIKPIAQR